MIAFPFILCFISAPFVFAGIIFYMWREKKEAERFDELIQRRSDALIWYRDRFDAYFKQHGVPMPEWQSKRLEEEAKEKFGVDHI